MSPTCSIMVAMEIGAMTRIAVMSNFASWKCGIPMKLAFDTASNTRIAEPSGFVMPIACMISAHT